MLLTPSVSNFKSGEVNQEILLKFFDSGRSIYIALDENTKSFGRDFVKEFGAELFPLKATLTGGEKGQRSIKNTTDHSVVWTKSVNKDIENNIAKLETPIAYRGTAFKLDSDNDYVFPILSGDKSVKVESSKDDAKVKKIKNMKGKHMTLVAGYQSRYNQRVVMTGSVDMCTDDFISDKKSSNFDFCLNILKWNFQQKSVLRLDNFDHSLVDTSLIESGRQKRQEYKLKDEIQVSFDILEKVDGEWVPFKNSDVKLQFIMLNPYVTKKMKFDDQGKYTTKFHVPDHNGVYKFKIDFNKHGYSRVFLEKIAPVRVFNHDEFPKYVPSSYPYYGVVLAVIAAFVLFTISFATTEDVKIKTKKEKTE